jgi:hypothetical protein
LANKRKDLEWQMVAVTREEYQKSLCCDSWL